MFGTLGHLLNFLSKSLIVGERASRELGVNQSILAVNGDGNLVGASASHLHHDIGDADLAQLLLEQPGLGTVTSCSAVLDENRNFGR